MFKKKGITLSPSLYFVTALSYMALGLFSTLIIGLIMKTAGGQLLETSLSGFGSTLIEIGDVAIGLTGPAIGIAIAYALQAPPLILFSALVVGAFGYEFGPAGSYVATLLAVEVSKLVSKSTKLDILVTPFTTIGVGYLAATYIGKYVGLFMTQLGTWIEWGTEQQPLFMGVVVATLMGLALTAPISSAAIALMLGLSGIAAGAATVGCAAQMVGFAITSYRDNGIGGAIAQGIGTSMLQVGNIVKDLVAADDSGGGARPNRDSVVRARERRGWCRDGDERTRRSDCHARDDGLQLAHVHRRLRLFDCRSGSAQLCGLSSVGPDESDSAERYENRILSDMKESVPANKRDALFRSPTEKISDGLDGFTRDAEARQE